jgi:hypothetical protein
VTNQIPAHLHADLSPLLVRAAEWPDARALSVVPPYLPPGETDVRLRRPVPPELELELEALLSAVEHLVHPALRSGGLERHLYWTATHELYFRLRLPQDLTREDGAPGATVRLGKAAPLSGWASFAPTAGGVRAFCLYARQGEARGPAGPDTLLLFLSDLLTPDLAGELAAITPRAAPASGPTDHAAIYRLDPSGYGVAYGYVYGYTNGQRVVAAIQPLVHSTL